MKIRVLITGASGNLAKELIKVLEENPQCEIWGASSRPQENHYLRAKIISNDLLENCLKQNSFDVFVHSAFPRNVNAKQWASGIDFSFKVLFWAYKYGCKRVIHISSQSIYGWDREFAAVEGGVVSLNNPYSTGKYCIEQLVKYLFDSGIYTNIRLSTIIGNHTDEKVPNKFMHQLITNCDLNIQGGDQIFSFLDIRDAVDALCLLIMNDKDNWREIYNIGTEEYYTLLEIANKCLCIAKQHGNTTSKINITPVDITLNNRLDCNAFYEDFGWKAKYSLDDTLLHMFEHYTVRKVD